MNYSLCNFLHKSRFSLPNLLQDLLANYYCVLLFMNRALEFRSRQTRSSPPNLEDARPRTRTPNRSSDVPGKCAKDAGILVFRERPPVTARPCGFFAPFGRAANPARRAPTGRAAIDNAHALGLARKRQSKTLRGRVRRFPRRRRRRNRPGNAQALRTALVMTLWKEARAISRRSPTDGGNRLKPREISQVMGQRGRSRAVQGRMIAAPRGGGC